jgi:hypothetical protein
LFSNKVLEQNYKSINGQNIIYFNLQVIDKTETFIKKYPDELLFSYFINDTLPHPATFIKSTLFDEIGLYDESLRIVSDWKFFVESVCKFNSSYKRIDEILSTFYLDGLSSEYQNKMLIVDEKMNVLQSSFQAFIQDNNELIELKTIISNLRKSRKIQMLLKLGLINNF